MSQANIIFIRGLPGSGKSYLAHVLVEQLTSNGRSVVLLDPDAVDTQSDAYFEHVEQQTREGVDPVLHQYRFLRAQAFAGIDSGAVIVWNQAFTNLEAFNNITARFKEHATEANVDLQILIVEVDTPVEIAKARVSERASKGGHDVSNERFDKFVADYKSFVDEGYSTIIVNGLADAKVNTGVIIARII